VTPEIVRVIFLLRTGSSFSLSFGFKQLISSELDGIFARLYFSAIFILARLTSLLVGWGMLRSISMISLWAWLFMASTSYALERF
jgi:hypothetical protein